MTRLDDIEKFEQGKQTKERAAYANQKIQELIKKVTREIGEGVKFTVDGKIVLPEGRSFSNEPDDEAGLIEGFSRELGDLIEQGGAIPQEFLTDKAK